VKHRSKNKPCKNLSRECHYLFRLSVIEAQNKEILSLLKQRQMVLLLILSLCRIAIRAHISGDRGPMDQLEKLWKSGLYAPPGESNG